MEKNQPSTRSFSGRSEAEQRKERRELVAYSKKATEKYPAYMERGGKLRFNQAEVGLTEKEKESLDQVELRRSPVLDNLDRDDKPYLGGVNDKETGIESTRRHLQGKETYHMSQLDRIQKALNLIEEDTRIRDLNDLLREVD